MVQLVDSNLGSGTVDINQRTNSNHEANHSEQDKMLSTMKKELSKKELKEEVREKLKDIKDNLEITKDIRCGFGFIQGKILQKFATQEVFVLLYGILGATIQAGASYFSGTISTLEKRYRIPSRNMGVILTGNDIILALFGIPITYYAGRKHKPRWMCIGMLFIVAFCLLNTFPHVIYGSGKEALALTKEYEEDHYSSLQNATDESLCSKEGVECIKEGSLIPQAIFFVSQLMWGIGSPLYGNLGMAYMDDNIKRSKTPILISFSFFIKMLGPVGGYCLAAWCLNMFISPELTPTIITKDPRWLGAWWLGWVIVAVIMAFFSFMIALFPKELPDRAVRKLLEDQTKDEVTKKKEEVEAQISWKDMKITFGRLLRNKILMCSTVGSLFYCFGYYPYWTYMPKYIEMQYKVSASKSSLITGVVGLVFTALGIISSGAFVSKVRPRARCLGGFNVFAGVVTILGIFSYTLLGCAEGDDFNAMIGRVNAQKMTTCNADCNCDFSRYSPICSMDGTNMTYISPCHAGCRSSQILDDGSKIYHNCSCIGNIHGSLNMGSHGILGGSATMGTCTIDCDKQFYSFLAVVCLLKFIGSASKTSNVLLSVRSVEERDKAVSLGFGMTVLSLGAFIPAPIVFGWIMDQTCILWGKTCSGTGSCWVYDAAQTRIFLNYTTMCLIILSNVFEIAVWYYAKDIQIFDEEVGKDRKKTKKQKEDISNKEQECVKKSDYNPVNQNPA